MLRVLKGNLELGNSFEQASVWEVQREAGRGVQPNTI